MKKLLLLAVLAAGFAFSGFGSGSEAQAKPHGWHGGHGHHAMYRHGPRRHYGWNRGHHYGWYKHRPRHHYYGYHRYRHWY
ncbi:hypothetical protein [Bosea thiooxidans]